jgi:hypothetical protein
MKKYEALKKAVEYYQTLHGNEWMYANCEQLSKVSTYSAEDLIIEASPSVIVSLIQLNEKLLHLLDNVSEINPPMPMGMIEEIRAVLTENGFTQ